MVWINYYNIRGGRMKVGFVSLGCPKNQLDTEVMLHELMQAGYEITPVEAEADVIVINTCAFIESAKQESIDTILEIARLKEDSLKGIVVTGCLAERYHKEILEQLPEVDAVIGVGSIHEITKAVKAVGEKKERFCSCLPADEVVLGGERILTTPDYYSYLKISEGCDNKCTYCAIPYIRGKFRSRPIDELVEEAKQLDELGVKELCIIAQDTTRYGLDLYGEYSLHKLLHRITEETNIPWLRLLYCYPDKFTDELVAEIRDNDRIVKYIDMPLQHISDKILKRMNRKGDSTVIKDAIARLRREIPGISIRTTFIVGFPGETEEDFNELCDFVHEARFDRAGVFTYSREEGTPAYNMPDQIDEQIKLDRMDIIMRDQMDINESINAKKIGEELTVLYEGFDTVSETHYGRSAYDAPEIDGKVYFKVRKKKAMQPGDFVKVKITESVDYDLFGVMER